MSDGDAIETKAATPVSQDALQRVLESAYKQGAGNARPEFTLVDVEGTPPFYICALPGIEGHPPKVQTLPVPGAPPAFMNNAVEVLDVRSFQSYFDINSSEATLVHSSMSQAKVTATFDYGHSAEPGRREHTCSLVCVRTQEWTMIKKGSGQWMSQEAFASFIDELAHCFDEPDPASMTSLVLNLEGTSNVAWKSNIDRTSGAAQIQYTEEAATKPAGTMKFPTQGTFSCRVFESSDPMQFLYRFQYRVSVDGKLTVRFVVDQFPRWEKEAFLRVVDDVSAKVQTTVLVSP